VAEPSTLEVWLHGQTIGTLTRLPGDRNLFAFTEQYVDNPERPTLSLSFKDAFDGMILDIPPVQTRLPPFFSNLLPEGHLREYLARLAGVNPTREFLLLWALGRDLPGALQIRTSDGSGPVEGHGAPSRQDHSSTKQAAMRFSLAGVQLKFSAIREAKGSLTIPVDGTGGSWIVKLPSNTYKGVPENEFAMMELARRVGINVPETALIPIEEIKGLPRESRNSREHAYAIRRFDRDARNGAVHIEDFAQVFRVYPERKYERASYRNIAQVLWVETGASGIVEFLNRLVFNALIGNADMHLKNWSLIYPDKRKPQLAPAYDFVSTIAYIPDDKLALTFVDSKDFDSLKREQFVRFAAKAGLPEKLTLDTVNNAVKEFRAAWDDSVDLKIPPHVRSAIDRHLKRIPIWRNH
jgi:serine/threonine-protein kinase HipA